MRLYRAQRNGAAVVIPVKPASSPARIDEPTRHYGRREASLLISSIGIAQPGGQEFALRNANCAVQGDLGRFFGKFPARVAPFISTRKLLMTTTSDRVSELLLRQNPPRDPLTGRRLKDLTPRALAAVLERYPALRAVAPELPDPNAIPKWDISWSPLLRDPAPVRHEPTKPVTYSLFRICAHEAAHAVVAHRCGLAVARVTTKAGNGNLGQVLHADGSRRERAVVLLAGREGEIALLGNAGTGDGSDTREALKLARDDAGGDEGKASQLMRVWRETARKMVSDNLRAVSKLAFELHRRREIEWDDIAAVIDSVARSQQLDDEWQHRIALARARISVREYKAEQEAKKRADWTRELMNKTLIGLELFCDYSRQVRTTRTEQAGRQAEEASAQERLAQAGGGT
jgi:hypothetical protein